MKKIILASGSPRRQELLSQIGISFEVRTSDADESLQDQSPSEAVEELSFRKASDVASKPEYSDCYILGADTVVALQDGTILGKPSSEEEAYAMLNALQGNTHSVYTGVTIISTDTNSQRAHTFHVQTDVTVYPMTKQEITDYIATGEPMDKAGAYGIQGAFAAYIKEIHGDYSNVVGLPLGALVHEWKMHFPCN